METPVSVVVVYPFCGHMIEFDSPSADDPEGLMKSQTGKIQPRTDGKYYISQEGTCIDCHNDKFLLTTSYGHKLPTSVQHPERTVYTSTGMVTDGKTTKRLTDDPWESPCWIGGGSVGD